MENDIQIAAEQAGKCIKCFFNTGWNVVSHWELPEWLRDNEFLSHGHRPQLPSFKQCFSSMFRCEFLSVLSCYSGLSFGF